jgi:hypothetical protein
MRPWMDRFEAPSSVSVLDLTPKDCQDDEHIALVWDRGPAGDFVCKSIIALRSFYLVFTTDIFFILIFFLFRRKPK